MRVHTEKLEEQTRAAGHWSHHDCSSSVTSHSTDCRRAASPAESLRRLQLQSLCARRLWLHRSLALGVQVGGRGSLSPGRQGKIDMYL